MNEESGDGARDTCEEVGVSQVDEPGDFLPFFSLFLLPFTCRLIHCRIHLPSLQYRQQSTIPAVVSISRSELHIKDEEEDVQPSLGSNRLYLL